MQATPNSQAWATTLLDECHKLVLSYISPHLQKMFENSNLAFLEFAEKAQSSASQIQFMEALTVIQKNRKQVEEVFYREVGSSFLEGKSRLSFFRVGGGRHHVRARGTARNAQDP